MVLPKKAAHPRQNLPMHHHDHGYAFLGSKPSREPLKAVNGSVDHSYCSADSLKRKHKIECPLANVVHSLKVYGEKLDYSASSIFQHSTSAHCQDLQSPPRKKDKLSKENARLQEKVVELQKQVNNSNKVLAAVQEEVLKEKKWWEGRFGVDQIAAAKSGTSRGRQWSIDSVVKGLKMRFSGSSSGLKCASDVVFPLPGKRTLQRRIQHIDFNPGILSQVLDAFGEELKNYELMDKDCVLLLDDMSIKSRRDFDPGTKSFIGGVSLKGVEGLATKATVFLFAGVRKRWKITGGYHFVPNQQHPEIVKVVVLDLLDKAHRIGLNVLAIVCDMGNRGLLSALGFCTQKDNIVYCIPHPCDPSRKLYCIPDMVHLLKSFKEVFMNNPEIKLSDDIVHRFNLPTSVVKFEHIRLLSEYQENMNVKFAPKLKSCDLSAGHFDKMKVHSAYHVFNDKVAEGLNFLVFTGELNEDCAATAWFVKVVNRWFTLVSNRSRVLALSLKNPDAYKQAIDDLKLMIEVVSGMSFGTWKVVQTHIIIATSSILELQEDLLINRNYDFVRLGDFLQDVLENVFSVMRLQRPVPSALEFKYRLKQVVFSQFDVEVINSSYDYDGAVEAIGLKHLLNNNKAPPRVPKDITFPVWQEPPPAVSHSEGTVLYRMCGYVIFKLVRLNIIKCLSCKESLLAKGLSSHPLNSFTKSTNYSENAQVEVSDDVFQLLYRVEFNLQRYKSIVRDNPDCTSDCILQYVLLFVSEVVLSQCHPVTTAVVSHFVNMRLKQFTDDFLLESGPALRANSLGSKSMGSSYLAKNYNPSANGKRAVSKTACKRLLM